MFVYVLARKCTQIDVYNTQKGNIGAWTDLWSFLVCVSSSNSQHLYPLYCIDIVCPLPGNLSPLVWQLQKAVHTHRLSQWHAVWLSYWHALHLSVVHVFDITVFVVHSSNQCQISVLKFTVNCG